jgi:hypothetical protein
MLSYFLEGGGDGGGRRGRGGLVYVMLRSGMWTHSMSLYPAPICLINFSIVSTTTHSNGRHAAYSSRQLWVSLRARDRQS